MIYKKKKKEKLQLWLDLVDFTSIDFATARRRGYRWRNICRVFRTSTLSWNRTMNVILMQVNESRICAHLNAGGAVIHSR